MHSVWSPGVRGSTSRGQIKSRSGSLTDAIRGGHLLRMLCAVHKMIISTVPNFKTGPQFTKRILQVIQAARIAFAGVRTLLLSSVGALVNTAVRWRYCYSSCTDWINV